MNRFNTERKRPNRGEMWICDFGVNVGSEQNGVRPCIVVNQKRKAERTCIVIPESNRKRKQGLTIGHRHFVLHQIRAVDTQRLLRRIGTLDKHTVHQLVRRVSELLM